MRRVSIVVGLAVVLTGCLTGGPATSASPVADSPTAGPPESATTTAPGALPGLSTVETADTDRPGCEEAPVETVNPIREDVSPSPLPERPAELNESALRTYVTAYEAAYKRNTDLHELTTTYSIHVSEVTVRAADGGWVVNASAIYWFELAGTTDGTTTPTVAHADGPRYTASYFVTDDRMLRDTTLDGDELSPRRGRVVECWDDS